MNKHWCRVLLWSVAIALVSGCWDDSETKSITPHQRIGVLLYGDSRIPQTQGFVAGLEEFGFKSGENIDVTIVNAKNDKNKLTELADTLIRRGVDVLVAAGGLEAEALRRQLQGRDLQLIVLYINAIIERGFVEDRRAPGWNVTGVDNLNAELSGKRIELLHTLVPEAKRILVLFHPKIKPSVIGVTHARAYAEKLGLEIDDRAVVSRAEIRQVMESLKKGDVDAMLTVPTAPIDNALKEIILPNVERLGIALMTHSRPMAEAGALASYGAPFYDIGKQAARLANKVMSGTRADQIPFEVPIRYIYTINKSVMERLGIEMSGLARSQVNEFVE